MLNPSPGRVLFLHCGVVIMNEVTEQTAIILDVAVDRTREPIGVDMVTIGFIILLLRGLYTRSAFEVGEQPMMIPSNV